MLQSLRQAAAFQIHRSETARERAYRSYGEVQWSGKFCRTDVGLPRPGRGNARRQRFDGGEGESEVLSGRGRAW